jgi:casein kinase 1
MSQKPVIHKYVLHEKIGKGCFSSVFKGIHKVNNKEVAIKIESESAPLNMLKRESKILSYLNKEISIDNRWITPVLFWYGKYGEHICMATTFYPKTLVSYISDLWNMNKPNLLIEIAHISYQIIEIFQHLHGAFILHCDIKPDNFMINECEKIVLIDFGLACLYVESNDTTKHRRDEPKEHLIGSAKYASYFLHNGHTPSRRDDMISVGYLLLVLFKVNIPWSDIAASQSIDAPKTLEPTYEEYHIMHPHNIIRKNMKSPEYLFKYIKSVNKPIETKYLLPYLENVYNIGAIGTPDYYILKALFSRLY